MAARKSKKMNPFVADLDFSNPKKRRRKLPPIDPTTRARLIREFIESHGITRLPSAYCPVV